MVRNQETKAMKAKWPSFLLLAALVVGTIACYRPYGSRFFPGTPHFAPTDPRGVELLRHEPRRAHIRLGEVWINPEPGMNRFYVESMLRKKSAAMGADALVIVSDRFFREGIVYNYWGRPEPVYERQIVGIAIRFRR
jgi:hypothetical protein